MSSGTGPLHKKHIITTQPHKGVLEEMLIESGADVSHVPLIEIMFLSDTDERDNINFDWLFFTSQNGVYGFFESFPQAVQFASQRSIATVGPFTAQALKAFDLTAQFISPVSDAESAAQAFYNRYSCEDLNILWPCGNLANQQLAKILNQAGASVTPLKVYETHLRQTLSSQEYACLNREIDMIVFTSASAVQTLQHFQEKGLSPSLSKDVAIACLGPKTTIAVKSLWGHVNVQAYPVSLTALAEAILEYYCSLSSSRKVKSE